jgi:small-conductance mechanosensitive channel
MMGCHFKRTSVILFFILILPLFLAAVPDSSEAQDDYLLSENAVIMGFVKDIEEEIFLSNITVVVERENYLGKQTITDETGFYQMNITEGNYIVRLYDEDGFVIYRTNFTIKAFQIYRHDFILTTHDIDQSRIYGTIRNKITYTPMEDAEIRVYRIYLTGEKVFYNKVTTDRIGEYEIKLPAGEFELQVWADDERIQTKKFDLYFGQEKKFDFELTKPTRTFTIDNIIRLISEKWLSIIAIIIVLIIGLFLNAFADRAFKAFEIQVVSQPGKFLDISVVRFIERVVKWNILLIVIIIAVYLLAQILDAINLLWEPLSSSITSIYVIILLIIFMRIGLMIWKQFMIFIRGGKEVQKPKKIISPRVITIIEILGKYILISVFGVGILITGFAALGMSDIIIGGFVGWFANNAGFIIFIITLIIITWVVLRFMTTFFEDVKHRTTRFRPEMIDIASKGMKYFLYGIIGIIIVFTLLSAAGLGEIGQTIIIVFSLIIGMVVSMAATGSIGNILSGLVITAFKPFEEGDWVVIGEKHMGQIVESNLMFTKLKDLENEIIEIPNNLVLSAGIINWTSASKRGGFAVEIDASIGYDVPSRQVIELMKESAKDVPGVLNSPEPFVVTTEFFNHAIGYKLRFFIKSPEQQFFKKTDVMVNMQRKFAETGIEILSPEYFVRRPGKIPTGAQIKGRIKKFNKFEASTDSK